MKDGWWINYETGHYVLLKCRGIDHEFAIRDPENQKWLGLSPSVIKHIYQFRPVQDRNDLLLHLMKTAPLMRVRGHGDYVTFEFSSDEEVQPLDVIRRWVKKNAGEATVLNIVNFSGSQVRAVSVLPHQLDDLETVQLACIDDWSRGMSGLGRNRQKAGRSLPAIQVFSKRVPKQVADFPMNTGISSKAEGV